MENQSIDGKLLFAKNAITNGRDVAAISAVLVGHGYDTDTLNEGMALYEVADSLHLKQKQEYGEQYAATGALQAAKEAADKTYMRHLKLARVALKDEKSAEAALQLSGIRKESMSGWIQQAKAFYTNASTASAAIKQKLAKVSVSEAEITAGVESMKQIEALLSVQLKEKGEAQDATLKRDTALDDLQEWMSDYIAIARVALEDQPQLLETLGIVEPS